MIVSFYDKNLDGILDNASLSVEDKSFRLVKRPIEFNELTCKCEAFNQKIQPTFLVIKDNIGRYVYGSLAGVPIVNKDNQTEINGTDLRNMLSSDIFLDTTSIDWINAISHAYWVDYAIATFFMIWDKQHDNGFDCELYYSNYGFIDGNLTFPKIYETGATQINYDYVDNHVGTTDFKVSDYKTGIYNCYEEIQKFMRFYNLYLETQIDLVNKKIKFFLCKSMVNEVNLKLWEYGIKDYGKIVADINEAQGYVVKTEKNQQDENVEVWYDNYDNIQSIKWILTKNGDITTNDMNRDIYPVKRRLITSNEDMLDANKLAIEELLNFKFNENIDLISVEIKPDFTTCFNVYTERGGALYKKLPCGELEYNSKNELVRFKSGYRYTTVNFI